MEIRRGLMGMSESRARMKLIKTYTVPESWENDKNGNPPKIMETILPDWHDDWNTIYWLLFVDNQAQNAQYKANGILWGGKLMYMGYTIRANKTAIRYNSSTTSAWASAGTIIKVYQISLFE